MADFCMQCSLDTFGEDSQDLVGITSPESNARKRWAIALCEGCGSIQVDHLGQCISNDCLKEHGLQWKWTIRDRPWVGQP